MNAAKTATTAGTTDHGVARAGNPSPTWSPLFVAGLELPPGMPGISPALVTLVPATAVAKDIPAGDTIIPG